MMVYKTRYLFVVVLAFLVRTSHAQEPAIVNIKVENFPYLLVAPTTYFTSPKEYEVKKVSNMNFQLTYYGKEPKLFLVNFREVLITPGDSVDLVYNRISADDNNHQDELVVRGSNTGNYFFPHFISDRMPQSYFPDYKMEKYQKNISLLTQELFDQHKMYSRELSSKMEEYKMNPALSAFIKRRSELRIIFELIYVDEKLPANHAPFIHKGYKG